MPFEIQHTPLSALLGLGAISGQGVGIAQRKAERIRQANADADRIAQQLAQAAQIQQQNNALAANQQANSIQTGLEYTKLASQQAQAQNELAQQQATEAARQKLTAEQGQQEQALKSRQLDIEEKKVLQAQGAPGEKQAQVFSMIDAIYPPGSEENQRLRLQFAGSGKIPAPQSQSEARNLNSLTLARKTLVDEFGNATPGKEEALGRLDAQIEAIVNQLGGATGAGTPAAANQVSGLPPIFARNPQTGQRLQFNYATGQWDPVQ